MVTMFVVLRKELEKRLMENTGVYISAMKESLKKKHGIMAQLLAYTKEQDQLLRQERMDMEQFERILGAKDELLQQITTLDNGFTSIFQKISAGLEMDKQRYVKDIVEMQGMIREITDIGVQIEGQERKNKTRFEQYLVKERQEIKKSRQSSRTAVSYYQNMPDQHHAWQTYFMDQKK